MHDYTKWFQIFHHFSVLLWLSSCTETKSFGLSSLQESSDHRLMQSDTWQDLLPRLYHCLIQPPFFIYNEMNSLSTRQASWSNIVSISSTSDCLFIADWQFPPNLPTSRQPRLSQPRLENPTTSVSHKGFQRIFDRGTFIKSILRKFKFLHFCLAFAFLSRLSQILCSPRAVEDDCYDINILSHISRINFVCKKICDTTRNSLQTPTVAWLTKNSPDFNSFICN